MNIKCRFEEFLINHQEDLKRIVGKNLNKNSQLTVEEVVSTVNLQLIKTKAKFFERFGYNFKKSDFGKWAYAYALNNTKWGTIKSFKDNEKLQDGTFYTEDGEKTLFEIICDQEGKENEELEEFDADGKLKVIENIINKYSHILSAQEKEVFSRLLRGKSELELSEEFEVSRQAINQTKERIYDKIKAYYHFSVEDAPKISSVEMSDHIDVVLNIFHKVEKRRLRVHCTTKHKNANFYEYAPE